MFTKIMKDGESAMETGGPQYKNVLKRSLSGSEIPKCNESRDIRMEGIKSEPFCHSGNRNVRVESSEKNMNPVPGNRHDSNLSSDTTIPNENNVTGMYEPPWTDSAQKVASSIVKNCNAMGGHGNGVKGQVVGKLGNIKKDRTLNS